MSLCKHCISGVKHEGTPEGKKTTINGVDVYVATPAVDYPRDKAVLFLSDVFGYKLINSQISTSPAQNYTKSFTTCNACMVDVLVVIFLEYIYPC